MHFLANLTGQETGLIIANESVQCMYAGFFGSKSARGGNDEKASVETFQRPYADYLLVPGFSC